MRLQERGFELDKLKNSWCGDQYKGINSQWTDSATGQRFELQFHTRISFEAKQLTHSAYERLRTRWPDKFEQMVLEAFQKRSPPRCRFPPAPPAFLNIQRETRVPDKVTYYAVMNDLSSREQPAGVFRRTYTEDGGRSDEAFTRNLRWEFSPALISAERGDLQNEFVEITEDEANQLVARIRARKTGTG